MVEYNVLATLEACKGVFDDSAGFVLYMHVLPAIFSLLFGAYVLFNKRDRYGALLAAIAVTFSLYVVLDLLLWMETDKNTLIVASWSMLGLLAALLYFFTHWFVHEFVNQDRLPAWMAAVWLVLLLPVFVFTPTLFNIQSYDLANCAANEGPWFTNYYYALGGAALALMLVSGYRAFRKKNRSSEATAARTLVFIGACLFVVTFLATGVLASYLVDAGIIPDFGIDQYGLAAMAVFIGLLGYTTVRYHAFNMKLLAAQALVIALVLLIAAEFLFVQSAINRWLVGTTLVLAVGFGWLLVRSVKREVEQRHRIEKLAHELEETNQRQESLIHFVGHEVKGYLTKSSAAFASLAEGDFGPLSETMKPFITNALAQSREGSESVIDILKASNLKKGTVAYEKEPFDLAPLVGEWHGKLKPMAEKKGLALNLSVDASAAPYTMTGDKGQLGDHVLRNLIENSINYTPTGSVDISLTKRDGKLVFAVKDTGIGISEEDKKRLFTEGGHGKESIKVNVHSTGYGLFIAKSIVDAHGGTIRAESEGPGKGSRFVVELPAA